MVLDMARPKNKQMLQESWLSRSTFHRYSRSISERSILSWITTRNRMDKRKVQRVWWTCERRPYIQTHSRGKEKIQRTMVSHLEQVRQIWACETSIKHFVVGQQVWMELEVGSQFFLLETSFCDSWFRLQSIAIHHNRRGVLRDTPHTSFFSCSLHNSFHAYHIAWLKCLYACVIPSSCHPWWAFDRPFVVRLFVFVLLLFLSVVYFFSSLSY